MKPKDIKAGMRAKVGVWRRIPDPSCTAGNERHEVAGIIICRRRGVVRFQPDANARYTLNEDYPGWTDTDADTYKVHVLDLIEIAGMTIEEFSSAARLPAARALD